MTYRQPLPIRWLMTDLRFGDRLLPAIQALPCGSGVIFRDYQLGSEEREKLFRHVRRIARRRGLLLLVAGDEALARRWQADGFHQHSDKRRLSRRMVHSTPVHNAAEITRALRTGADMLLLSPLFATASHPGASPLGRMRFMQLAKLAGGRAVIALGGVTARKAATLERRHVHGWAGIDAFKI